LPIRPSAPTRKPDIPALLGKPLTRIAEVLLGHRPPTAALNTRFVAADYRCFTNPKRGGWRHRKPERFNRDKFALKVGAYAGNINKYYPSAGLQLRECAIALAVLFGHPIPIGDRLALRFEALSSPIGPDVTGPAKSKSRDESTARGWLVGPTISEPFGYPHALIARPRDRLTPATLVSQMTKEMLEPVQDVIEKIRKNCASPDALELLRELKVDREALMRRTANIDLLVPRLEVGKDLGGEKLDFVYSDAGRLLEWIKANYQPGWGETDRPVVRKAVVEIDDDPIARNLDWQDVRSYWFDVSKLIFGAHPAVSSGHPVVYAFEFDRATKTRLTRAHRATVPGPDTQLSDAVLSVALLGFDTARAGEAELARAISYFEALTTRKRAWESANDLGERYVPTLTQLQGSGRLFVESMRTVQNLACLYEPLVNGGR
jgi:hypothetical protein